MRPGLAALLAALAAGCGVKGPPSPPPDAAARPSPELGPAPELPDPAPSRFEVERRPLRSGPAETAEPAAGPLAPVEEEPETEG